MAASFSPILFCSDIAELQSLFFKKKDKAAGRLYTSNFPSLTVPINRSSVHLQMRRILHCTALAVILVTEPYKFQWLFLICRNIFSKIKRARARFGLPTFLFYFFFKKSLNLDTVDIKRVAEELLLQKLSKLVQIIEIRVEDILISY